MKGGGSGSGNDEIGEPSVKILSFQIPPREQDQGDRSKNHRVVGFERTVAGRGQVQKKEERRDGTFSQLQSSQSVLSPPSAQHRSTKTNQEDSFSQSAYNFKNLSQQAWIPPGKARSSEGGGSGGGGGLGGGSGKSRREEDGSESKTWALTSLPIVYSDGAAHSSSRSLLKRQTENLHRDLPLLGDLPKTSSLPDYTSVFYFRHNDLYGKNLETLTSPLGEGIQTPSQYGLKSK